jgi:hypothetical protein
VREPRPTPVVRRCGAHEVPGGRTRLEDVEVAVDDRAPARSLVVMACLGPADDERATEVGCVALVVDARVDPNVARRERLVGGRRQKVTSPVAEYGPRRRGACADGITVPAAHPARRSGAKAPDSSVPRTPETTSGRPRAWLSLIDCAANHQSSSAVFTILRARRPPRPFVAPVRGSCSGIVLVESDRPVRRRRQRPRSAIRPKRRAWSAAARGTPSGNAV